MKTTIISLLCLCAGLAGGWYFGHTRPLLRAARDFRAITGWDDAQLRQAFTDSRTAMKTMEADDTSTVIHCAAALKHLEAGNVEQATRMLTKPLISFYTIYGPPNAPGKKMSEERLRTLQFIERTAAEIPMLQREITPKP